MVLVLFTVSRETLESVLIILFLTKWWTIFKKWPFWAQPFLIRPLEVLLRLFRSFLISVKTETCRSNGIKMLNWGESDAINLHHYPIKKFAAKLICFCCCKVIVIVIASEWYFAYSESSLFKVDLKDSSAHLYQVSRWLRKSSAASAY